MFARTDLALESYESSKKTVIRGVKVEENENITTVKVLDENGSKMLSKPVGTYITLKVKSFINDTDIFDGRLDKFSKVLNCLLPENLTCVLVAGMGNRNITADSLGPKVNDYVLSTRHIADDLSGLGGLKKLFSVATIQTGVLGETGIETAEIIKGVASQINPSCIIAVDALASSSMERLGTTVQFSDTGIIPGSGVGNHRREISKKTLGIPVISIGIPTVVSTCNIAKSCGDNEAFVTPREIDRICEQGAKLIGMGINVCFQKEITPGDLYALVG